MLSSQCLQFIAQPAQGKLKATLQGNKLTFSHETGCQLVCNRDVFFAPHSRNHRCDCLSFLSADGSAELRLKALSARAVSLEQQLQHEVRRTEVSIFLRHITSNMHSMLNFQQLQRSKVTVGRP